LDQTKLAPSHDRHHEVQQDQAGLLFARDAQSFSPVVRGQDRYVKQAKPRLEQDAALGIILNHEYGLHTDIRMQPEYLRAVIGSRVSMLGVLFDNTGSGAALENACELSEVFGMPS